MIKNSSKSCTSLQIWLLVLLIYNQIIWKKLYFGFLQSHINYEDNTLQTPRTRQRITHRKAQYPAAMAIRELKENEFSFLLCHNKPEVIGSFPRFWFSCLWNVTSLTTACPSILCSALQGNDCSELLYQQWVHYLPDSTCLYSLPIYWHTCNEFSFIRTCIHVGSINNVFKIKFVSESKLIL